jgi:two-component system chemotaxis response regulator CheY
MSAFRNIAPLIIDPAGHSKGLLKRLLTNLGVRGVTAVCDTDEALKILRTTAFSIVFCDEIAGPQSPIEFAKALRRDLTTRDVTIPVVLVSGSAEISMITAARDAGMNDVIAKPMSALTIERKLHSLLNAPRSFVTAKTFVGPDRRRTGEDRRQFGECPDGAGERRSRTSDGTVFAVVARLNLDEPNE